MTGEDRENGAKGRDEQAQKQETRDIRSEKEAKTD